MIRDVEEEVTSQQVNVGFGDLEDKQTVSKTVVNALYQPTMSADAELSKYLSRPALIGTVSVATGATIDTQSSVWYQYFNNSAIKNKLENYAYIRCDLHLKIVINASPFYYGAILCSYKPLENTLASAPVDTTAGDNVIPYSQLPHVYVYPQTSEGGELVCPFIATSEWLRLGSASVTQNFGKLYIKSVVPMAYCGGGTANTLDLQIFAWAENVQLSGLTVDAVLQSGDEYRKDGVISKPASAVARAAGYLTNVPMIGPFATATEIGANAVSNIAKLFGYTKVPSVADTVPTKNLPFRSLAVSDISDATEKLSLDSKNELTVNNTCIGDPCADSLLISSFVQRSSYLTNFTWQLADVNNTLLWNTYINPYMSRVASVTGQHVINPTPMWIVSNMFQYWRGDIILDFKIICSQYHKGRLRFAWDPKGNLPLSTSTVAVYNEIVDISECTNISIRVPYTQRVAYCKTPSSVTSTIYSTSALSPDDSDTVNGILTVKVLNQASAPLNTADIEVLVSVRGAENMEFAAPKQIDNQIGFYTVQSSDVYTESDINKIREVCFGEPSTVDPNINLVYMGEKISSMRELLQRANFSRSVNFTVAASTESMYKSKFNRRPIYPGYDPNGIHEAIGIVSTGNETYNFVNATPYHLLACCFLGERGSITWTLNYEGHDDTTLSMRRSDEQLTASLYGWQDFTLNGSNDEDARKVASLRRTNFGGALINQRTNTGLSTSVPMYSQFTMLDTAPSTRTVGSTNVGSTSDTVEATAIAHNDSATEGKSLFSEFWFNCGPDHSFVYFLHVPTLYYYSAYPTAKP
jgi:hypothetical protein